MVHLIAPIDLLSADNAPCSIFAPSVVYFPHLYNISYFLSSNPLPNFSYSIDHGHFFQLEKMRKFRLVSLSGLEIGIKGFNGSSLLDSLLIDNPHKVATISIPFNDKTVLDFAKSLMDPEKEIDRDTAKRIRAVYKLLGIDIEIEIEENEIVERRGNNNVEDNAVVSKNALENESDEAKYIIKIELEQPQLAAIQGSVEVMDSICDISTAIEQTEIDSGENQTDLSIDNDDNIVQNSYVEDDDNDYQEIGVNASSNSNCEVMNLTQDNVEEAYDNSDINEQNHDQPLDTEGVDCYDNYSEDDFSFHEVVEDGAQESQDIDSIDASNVITEMTNSALSTSTVVRSILKITQSNEVSCQIHDSLSADSLHLKVPKTLRLKFVKTAVFPIRDISRKRKRKRGH